MSPMRFQLALRQSQAYDHQEALGLNSEDDCCDGSAPAGRLAVGRLDAGRLAADHLRDGCLPGRHPL